MEEALRATSADTLKRITESLAKEMEEKKRQKRLQDDADADDDDEEQVRRRQVRCAHFRNLAVVTVPRYSDFLSISEMSNVKMRKDKNVK
jgi:hypothetical protein